MKLFLDDARLAPLGWYTVRSYDEFVRFIEERGVPDEISFDHDLAFEHYPVAEDRPGARIPYGTYSEKTGYDCAKYLWDRNLVPKHWTVHSMNPVGASNIRNLLQTNPPQRLDAAKSFRSIRLCRLPNAGKVSTEQLCTTPTRK